MRINFVKDGYGTEIVQIDDAKIKFPNFAGDAMRYNHAGDRNFVVKIEDQEIADALIDAGYNVSIKTNPNEGEPPYMNLKVKVKFNPGYERNGPFIYIVSRGKKTRLFPGVGEDDPLRDLDKIRIDYADMDIAPNYWRDDMTGEQRVTAYLRSICVYQAITDRFADEEYPTE